ncbi:hypothetical protein [Corynebacterium xerosis]
MASVGTYPPVFPFDDKRRSVNRLTHSSVATASSHPGPDIHAGPPATSR